MTRSSRRIATVGVMVGVLGVPGLGLAQPPKLVAAHRGPAKVEITKPATKVSGKEVVTTILLKNVESAPIAGLKVVENWYSKAGQPIGGDTYRHMKPIQPGEVITVTLRSPMPPQGSRNQYQFTHINGAIKQTVVPKLEAPKPNPGT